MDQVNNPPVSTGAEEPRVTERASLDVDGHACDWPGCQGQCHTGETCPCHLAAVERADEGDARLPRKSRDAILALGDLLIREHGESCDCETCLEIHPVVARAVVERDASETAGDR